MKLYLNQLSELFAKISNNSITALLLYGPDKGYINKTCRQLIEKFQFIPSTFNYSHINSKELQIAANSINFFNQIELIKITDVTPSISTELKSLLKLKFLNFIVFIADELSPSSSIRKYFESESYLISIACYHDDEKNIAQLITEKSRTQGKNLTNEAFNFLKTYLKGDHQSILNELDKILIYNFNSTIINLDDVKQVISNNFIGNYDQLCISFSQKNAEKFIQEVEKLTMQNVNNISIIRTLIKFYINIYIVQKKHQSGESIDEAISSLVPPIFYKYLTNFKTVVSQISMLDAIKMIDIFQKAEANCKSNTSNFDLYFEIFQKAYQ